MIIRKTVLFTDADKIHDGALKKNDDRNGLGVVLHHT